MGSDETTLGRSIDPKLSLILGSSCYQLPFWRHPRSGCILSIFGDHKISFLPFLTKQVTDYHRSSQIYPAQFALNAFVTWFLEAAVLQLSFLPSPAVGRKVQGKIYVSCGKYTMFYVILALPMLVHSFPFSHTGTTNHYTDDLRGCTTSGVCPKPVAWSDGLSIGYPQWSNGNINFPNLPCLANEKRSTLFWGQVPVEKQGNWLKGSLQILSNILGYEIET